MVYSRAGSLEMILIFGFMHDLQLHVPELYYLAFKFFMEKWFQNLRLIKYNPLSNVVEMNKPAESLIEDLPYLKTFLSDHPP